MKIKLINKDKGTSPPSKGFDFRPNRTVDSNPKLNNMKGDYVSPKKHKRQKYQLGGLFNKYIRKYKQIDTTIPEIQLKNLRQSSFDPIIFNRDSEEPQETPQEQQRYSIYWGAPKAQQTIDNSNMTLEELFRSENIPIRITSGFRPGAMTASGHHSNHSLGDKNNPGAYDVKPVSGSFDDFERAIYSNPRIVAWLENKGWGTLREDAMQGTRRGFIGVDNQFHFTNATGPHFHFGPDSHAVKWREANKRKYMQV